MSATVTYKGETLTTVSNQTRTLQTAGKYLEGDVIITDVTAGSSLQTKTKSYTPAETAITESVVPDAGFDGMDEIDITVSAIPSNYVGSGITRRDSTDLTASGATVTVPVGYYSASASKAVASGTEGTPTATKGTVSNHSVSVTPSVTNSAGYIGGGTHTGTAVSVTAAELVSGTKSITANGNGIDVTTYAAVDVAVPIPAPSLQTKTANYTASTSTITDTITADVGFDGLDEVDVTVDAIPTAFISIGAGIQYVTTGGVRKWEVTPFVQELPGNGGFMEIGPYERIEGTTAVYNAVPSGTTVTPTTSAQTIGGANYMMEGPVTVSAMPSGSARPAATISGTAATLSTGTNTLTLTKTVSNTPQVTAGYVASGTAGNSSVSLTANITTQGAQTIYPSGSDQTIASARYLTGTQTIKAVTTANLTAENIKQGVTVTVGDSADADRILSVTGTYSGGGGSSKNAQVVQQGNTRIAATTYTKACGDITVSKTGTYDVYWSAYRTSTSGTWGTQLYISGVAYGSAQTTFSSYYQTVHLSNVSLTANQTVSVYGRSRGSNYYLYVGQLTIIEA